ncbi:MAG TPA: LacI family DNA-binding transcriptional regulator [Cellulomonas sp.]
MPRRPTVYDVAERAGVSIATVSFTFRQPERVRESTRATVLRAAEDLGYVPSASARGLAHGSTGALGLYSFDLLLAQPQEGAEPTGPDAAPVVGPDLDEPESDPRAFPLYVDEVQRGFELECGQRGQALLLSSGTGSSASVADVAGRVDGLAVFPGPTSVDMLAHVARRIPVVAFSMPPVADGLHHVTVDNRGGTRALVEHLIADHGLRDLAFVGRLLDRDQRLTAPDYAERFIGFQEALAGAGLPVPAEPLDATDLAEPHRLEVVSALADADRLPRALVCASDQLALAVLDLLAARGVPVPDRVAVTGFDGILAGRLSRPSLTTVRQPMTEMGRLAVQVLVRTRGTPAEEPESHQLPVRVVRRASCGCPQPV